MTWLDALIVGLFQIIAVFPGASEALKRLRLVVKVALMYHQRGMSQARTPARTISG